MWFTLLTWILCQEHVERVERKEKSSRSGKRPNPLLVEQEEDEDEPGANDKAEDVAQDTSMDVDEPVVQDDEDEDMWDALRELESSDPGGPSLAAAAAAPTQQAPSDADPPKENQDLRPTIEEGWDEMYA